MQFLLLLFLHFLLMLNFHSIMNYLLNEVIILLYLKNCIAKLLCNLLHLKLLIFYCNQLIFLLHYLSILLFKFLQYLNINLFNNSLLDSPDLFKVYHFNQKTQLSLKNRLLHHKFNKLLYL